MLSCEFCEISKNTLFTEHLRATASRLIYLSFVRALLIFIQRQRYYGKPQKTASVNHVKRRKQFQ